ncbi:MAG: methyltransferase domain-containing protein [Thermoplasmataceae archaeon]
MPRYILECSSLNLELVRNEISSISTNYGEFSVTDQIGNITIIEGNWEKTRLSAFVNIVDEILQEVDSPEHFDSGVLPGGKYFVRMKRVRNTLQKYNESYIGSILKSEGRISFKNYDFVVRVICAEHWYLTIQIYERDKKSLEQRRAPMRPFFSPVSLHPKFGIYLVNTTMTKPGETLLDPFCGTGGILIEAAIMGRRIIGSDSSLGMVMGARLNLKYFGYSEATIINSDIFDLKLDSKVDGIATDMPYGRNSTLNGRSVKDLYKKAFEVFHDVLKDGGRCAVVVGDISLLELTDNMFSIESAIAVPQHRSLTRYYSVLKKK